MDYVVTGTPCGIAECCGRRQQISPADRPTMLLNRLQDPVHDALLVLAQASPPVSAPSSSPYLEDQMTAEEAAMNNRTMAAFTQLILGAFLLSDQRRSPRHTMSLIINILLSIEQQTLQDSSDHLGLLNILVRMLQASSRVRYGRHWPSNLCGSIKGFLKFGYH